MQHNNDFLFVYGTLRSDFNLPVFNYIRYHFSFIGVGKMTGTLYHLGEYPAAIPGGENYITGELYQANSPEDFNKAIIHLDEYEGVYAEAGQAPLFKREKSTIFTNNNQHVQAWVYWYNLDIAGYPIIESGDMLAYAHQKNNNS